jgi:O-antigen chain-terminating methyltransferase
MVAVARTRGLDAQHADGLTHLASLPDDSLGGVIATQVVEHLEPSYLIRLLETASHKLQAGAPIVLETINTACWLAFFSSYLRDFTHVRPMHPETLQYLLRAAGFTRVDIRYSAPVPDHMKMKTIDLPADVLGSSDVTAVALAQVAHTVNANAVILNNLMFTHLDYAAVGYRS